LEREGRREGGREAIPFAGWFRVHLGGAAHAAGRDQRGAEASNPSPQQPPPPRAPLVSDLSWCFFLADFVSIRAARRSEEGAATFDSCVAGRCC
jgi:hypothetical protein